jgi:hypothetical protein
MLYFLLVGLLSSCTSSNGRSEVEELVSRLDEAGIPCRGLSIEEPPANERAEESDGAPVPLASGFCHLGELDDPQGRLSSIFVFADDEHVSFAEQRGGFPGVAIVYGDTFEMQVEPADMGEAVRDALEAKLIPPSGPERKAKRAVSGTLSKLSRERVCVRGPGCFELDDYSVVESGIRKGDEVEVGILPDGVVEYVTEPSS